MELSTDLIYKIMDLCPFDIYKLVQLNRYFYNSIKSRYKNIQPINNVKRYRVTRVNGCEKFAKAYPIFTKYGWVQTTCILPDVRSIVLVSNDPISNILCNAYQVEVCHHGDDKYIAYKYSIEGEGVDELKLKRKDNYKKALNICKDIEKNREPLYHESDLSIENTIIKFDPIFNGVDFKELYHDIGYVFGEYERFIFSIYRYEENRLNIKLNRYMWESKISNNYKYIKDGILLINKPGENITIELGEKTCDGDKCFRIGIGRGNGYNGKELHICEEHIGVNIIELSFKKNRVQCSCITKRNELCKQLASVLSDVGKPICTRHKTKEEEMKIKNLLM